MVFAFVLILVGLVYLGLNFGFLNASVFANLWKFWPVILIAVGIVILGKKYLPKWLTYIILGLLFLGCLAGVVYYENGFSSLSFSTTRSSETLIVDEPLSSDVTLLDLTLSLGAQSVDISPLKSGLLQGTIAGSGGKPVMTHTESNGTAYINISQKLSGWFGRNKDAKSQVSITNQIPVDLKLQLGASSIDADLSGIILDKLDLQTGAFNGSIKIGTGSIKTNVEVRTGASNIKLYIPKGSGLRVDQSTGLVSVRYNGIEMAGNQGDKQRLSKGYDNAKNTVDCSLMAGASTIEFISY